jgi:hypothetical protein
MSNLPATIQPTKLNPYVEAFKAPALAQMEPAKQQNRITEIIVQTAFKAGHDKNLTSKDAGILAQMLSDELSKTFPTLTLTELQNACNRGLLNEFGEWFGINYRTIMVWVKAYISDEKRNEAIAAYMKEQEAKQRQSQEPTPEEKAELNRIAIQKQFARYKAGEIVTRLQHDAFRQFCIKIYDELNLQTSEKEMYEITLQAGQNIRNLMEEESAFISNQNDKRLFDKRWSELELLQGNEIKYLEVIKWLEKQ